MWDFLEAEISKSHKITLKNTLSKKSSRKKRLITDISNYFYASKWRNTSSEWLYEQYQNACYAGGSFPFQILALLLAYITFLSLTSPQIHSPWKEDILRCFLKKSSFDQLGQKQLPYFWNKTCEKKIKSILQVLVYPFSTSINIK